MQGGVVDYIMPPASQHLLWEMKFHKIMLLLFSPTLTPHLRGFIVYLVELLIRKLTIKNYAFQRLKFFKMEDKK